MKKFGRIFGIFSFTLMLFLLNPLFFGDQARGGTHFIEALAIVRFDEKIKAQNFILQDLNGNKVSMEDYRGKIVFLNFWATWCPPCRVEMPSMEKLYNEFKSKDFTILAIDLQEDAATVKTFKEQYKLNFPILLDSDGSVALIYGAMSIPTTYLIDRDGYLLGGALGPRDWATEDAFELINHLLKISPAS